jgi:hypothetical protein
LGWYLLVTDWPGAAAVGVAQGQSPTPAATEEAIPGVSLVLEVAGEEAIIMAAGEEATVDTVTAAGVTMEEGFTRGRSRQVMRLEFIIRNTIGEQFTA